MSAGEAEGTVVRTCSPAFMGPIPLEVGNRAALEIPSLEGNHLSVEPIGQVRV